MWLFECWKYKSNFTILCLIYLAKGGCRVANRTIFWLQFELIKDFLKPVLGGNIIDASCGSGLLSRLFAKSGLFSLVVALDYSENMLKQTYEFIKKEENFPEEYRTWCFHSNLDDKAAESLKCY